MFPSLVDFIQGVLLHANSIHTHEFSGHIYKIRLTIYRLLFCSTLDKRYSLYQAHCSLFAEQHWR